MQAARYGHTATLLNNGLVLIAGGCCGTPTEVSAELYNPASGTFTLTGSLNDGRMYHSATLLNNGLVLVAGGFDVSAGTVGATISELYNPATGTFTLTGSLNEGRYGHTATLLNNGLVLVAGGFNFNVGLLSTAELFNPATGVFTYTVGGSNGNGLMTARAAHTATLLNNGMVLIAGGTYLIASLNGNLYFDGVGYDSTNTAELFNPATGTFSYTSNPGTGTQTTLNTSRMTHTATLLNNGMVLLAGGMTGNNVLNGTGATASAELY